MENTAKITLEVMENFTALVSKNPPAKLTLDAIKADAAGQVALTINDIMLDLAAMAHEDRKNWARRAYMLKLLKERHASDFGSMKMFTDGVERVFDIKKSQQANLIKLAEVAVDVETMDVKPLFSGFRQTHIIEMFVDGITYEDMEKLITSNEIHPDMSAVSVRKAVQDYMKRKNAVDAESTEKPAETETETAETEKHAESEKPAETEKPDIIDEEPDIISDDITNVFSGTHPVIMKAFDKWLERMAATIDNEKHRVMFVNLEHERFDKYLHETAARTQSVIRGRSPIDIK